MTCLKLKTVALAVTCLASVASSQAETLLTENFNDVSTLAGAGWVVSNLSSPVGSTSWFQGDTSVFSAHGGPANSYVAANFNSASVGGNIFNLLTTPVVSLEKSGTLTFWTRTNANVAADRLQVALSYDGTSTFFGSFLSPLTTINLGLAADGYPMIWSQYTVAYNGAGVGASGRFAFVYSVPNTAVNADYIGIDTLSVTAVPEPGTWAMMGLGLLGLGLLRRRGA